MSTTLADSKPMFSNRDLVRLTIPLVFDALLVLVAGLVDSVMVSSSGEAAVSAVALVDSLNLVFLMAFSSVVNGGVVVTSQYVGRGNMDDAQTSAKQLIYLAAIVSLTLTATLLFTYSPILRLVYGGVEADVFEGAKTYFFWIILGYPFVSVGAGCTALMRSMGKNKLSVMLTSGCNLLNVVGNAILIFGFDMGIAGAAISTSFSRVIYAVCGLLVMHNKHLKIHFTDLFKVKLNGGILKKIAVIGGTTGIESALFQIGKVLISSLMATFGTIAIAGYSVSYSINNIAWSMLGAFTTSLIPIVGQAMGAGRIDEAKMYTKKMTTAATVTMVILFGTIFLLRNQLVMMFDFEPDALREAAYYTGVAAVLSILSFYSWSFLPVGAFRAAGDVRYGLVVAILTMFIFRVGGAFLLSGYFKMGVVGIYLGMWADWFARAVMNFFRYRSGKWLTKKVI
ncbi:MAG: MATE family efflux transporter [Oscillospiraceae bacterium]|nr:MATE family efflux transporter [Oscillospiraceae bacterium]